MWRKGLMMRKSKREMRFGRVAATVVAILTASIGLWAATKGPDAAGYSATDATTYSFVDISGGGGGTSVLAGTDDGTQTLALPFPFVFYGQSYSLVCVSTNGALYFVSSLGACGGFNDFANTDLTSTATVNDLPAALPFWSDLSFDVPGAGGVLYQTLGSTGSRRFVVQWQNVYPQGSPNPVTFQIILSEGTNRVMFQYKNVVLGAGNPADKGAQATIGMRDAGAPDNDRQIAWSHGAPVIPDSSAILFSLPAPVTCAPVVTSSVTITRGNYVRDQATGRFSQTVSVRNKTASPIAGPISLVADSRTPGGVNLYQPSGTTSCAEPAGAPYVTISTGTLAAGATVSATLEFVSPVSGGIVYTPRVLSGTLR